MDSVRKFFTLQDEPEEEEGSLTSEVLLSTLSFLLKENLSFFNELRSPKHLT